MIKERLLNDLKEAMKDKKVNQKNAIQMARAAILQVEKDKGITLDDNKVLEIIAKEVKIRKDAILEYEKAQRQDLIDQVQEEINTLEVYLPKQLSDEELETEIKKIISEVSATSMKDMGNVMKAAKEKIGVAADGKRINEIVKKCLG